MAKSKRFTIVLIVSIIVVGLLLKFGAGVLILYCVLPHEKNTYDYALKYARNSGCQKILWVGSAQFGNEITGCTRELSHGTVWSDSVLTRRGGVYVIGEDRNGNELYFIVPNVNEEGTPQSFEWPFDYKFSEIAHWLSDYGYEYADGIVGHESLASSILAWDTKKNVEDTLNCMYKDKDEARAVYERLDIKFIFEYAYCPSENNVNRYYIMQEQGALKMYEIKNNELDNKSIYTYERR